MSVSSPLFSAPLETRPFEIHEGVTDEELVGAARRGDHAAEERLYRRHAPAVLTLATGLTRSREDGLDVLQDAFVTVFESLGDLREPAAFRGWVQRITVRLVHRRFRRRRLRRLLGLEPEREPTAFDTLADPSASPETLAELRLVDTALLSIPYDERIAWLLRRVERLSLEEVAEACACSLATAKRRIAAGEAVVARHLGAARVNVLARGESSSDDDAHRVRVRSHP